MPEGTPNLVFQRAVRGRFAPLIMISGPSGTGKTYSALRLAVGMAGPDGKICVADTDRGRAKLYANSFTFEHLDLIEPFRPQLFEAAALAAQQQGAAVLVIDNFGHEWAGPGGVLEWHEEELNRMAGDNFARREAMKMVGWAKVKPAHKKMLQRLYQLNMPIILCTYAERKVAVKEIVDDKGRKKTQPIDLGFQPVGDKDIAFAMTASLLLEDPTRPGVPRPIKALLPDLKPIISLDRPLDEQTGARLAAWASGKEPASAQGRGNTPEAGVTNPPPPDHTAPKSDSQIQTDSPPPPDDIPPADDKSQPVSTGSLSTDETVDPAVEQEERIREGARKLAARFNAVQDRRGHLAIVDEAEVRKQTEFLRKRRKPIYDEILSPAMKASWSRTEPPREDQQQQGDLMNDQADRAESDPGRR